MINNITAVHCCLRPQPAPTTHWLLRLCYIYHHCGIALPHTQWSKYFLEFQFHFHIVTVCWKSKKKVSLWNLDAKEEEFVFIKDNTTFCIFPQWKIEVRVLTLILSNKRGVPLTVFQYFAPLLVYWFLRFTHPSCSFCVVYLEINPPVLVYSLLLVY